MATPLERFAARFAFIHARRVYRRFDRDLHEVDRVQQDVLRRVLARVAPGEYGRRHGLDRVRSVADLRCAAPLTTYEDIRPTIEQVRAGRVETLFDRRQRILMFATSSGTTAAPKFIPVTPEFVAEYRRGWNTFGLKMLLDHQAAILRPILQSSSRYDESFAPSGVPCGAITGLMARTQKRIVRRFYVGTPEITRVADPQARYYTLMRFGVVRDVAFAITANPATLIRLAQIADSESERLIRDVRDGGVRSEMVGDAELRKRLSARLKPDAARARQLEELRREHGRLRPRDYWNVEFLACWTGGSMGHYLPTVAEWYGPVPIRDVGLLASEGRVSIPLDDGTPVGVLDPRGAVFEFIPAEEWNNPEARTLTPSQLEPGGMYTVVLTNAAGLVRYRLDDVVRASGFVGSAPLLEFLRRAGCVSSVAGEKLTEDQVVAAMRLTCEKLAIRSPEFVLAPTWGDPPRYRLTVDANAPEEFAETIDGALSDQNDEYASRRKSGRLGTLQLRVFPKTAFRQLDENLTSKRRSSAEQYKRPCLLTQLDEDDRLLGADVSRAD